MWRYRCCQAAWAIGTILIALSWVRVVDSQIGWLGFWVALGGSVLSRVRIGSDMEQTRLQETITWLDHAIESGEGALSENLLDRGVAKHDCGRFEDAIIDINAALEKGTERLSMAVSTRGFAEEQLGRYEDAISDFTKTLELLDPDDEERGLIYAWRASAYMALTEYEQCIADCDEAIRLDPNSPDMFFSCGTARFLTGDFRGAHDDFEAALKIDPDHLRANNQIAFILAACPFAELRNGANAVEFATRSCGLSNWRDWESISILAASYAETGDFDRAVRYARKALRLAPPDEHLERQLRIEEYLRHEPYRIDLEKEQLAYREQLRLDDDDES